MIRRRAHHDNGVAERYVRVGAGVDPEVTYVPAEVPLRLTLHRDGACRRDTVVFPALGRLVTLPIDEDVVVEFGPLPPGRYAFSCAGGSPGGTLVATA